MPRISRFSCGTALALCLPASAAFADLTSAEVWADWHSYLETAGYELTASEVRDGGTLTVTDVTMTAELGEEAGEGTATITMESVRFVEQDDGSVSVELPAQTRIDVDMTSAEDEDIDMTVTLDQTNPVMNVTGDADALTYTFAASAAALALSNLSIDGVTIGADIAKVGVSMADVSYVTNTSVSETRNVEQAIEIGEVSYDLAVTDPEGEGSFKLVGAMQNLDLDGIGELPLGVDTQDMNAMLNAGFGFNGVFTTTAGNYDLTFDTPDGSGTANSTSEGGEISFSMNTGGLLYKIAQRNVTFNMLLTEFPLPLSFSADKIGTSVQMPLQKSTDDQDFGLSLSLDDFTMSDVIWSLFDPSRQLPRDPATLLVDLSGKAKVLFDFLDPAQATVLEKTGAAPGELNALTLNTLELDAAGAKLTGSGDFTFDNSDLTSFDGLPRPLGGLDLTLTGGNGLLDKLVAMGLLPDEQAMGARMMMGLFAVPGGAPDTLNSRIEVNPEGHVLANGQRIR